MFSVSQPVYKLKVFFIFIFILFLSSCSKIDMKQFENNTPKLDLFSFFEGKTIAYGIFEDRFGNLKRQFRVNITGKVESNTLTLDEDFLYDDGEQANRIWKIKKSTDKIKSYIKDKLMISKVKPLDLFRVIHLIGLMIFI